VIRSPLRSSSPALRYIAQALDAAIVLTCGIGAYRHVVGAQGWVPIPVAYQLVMLMAVLALLICSPSIYRSWRLNDLRSMLSSVALAWLLAMSLVLGWLFVSGSLASYSERWLVEWAGAALLALCAQRWSVHSGLRFLRARGYNSKTLVLVERRNQSARIQHALAESAWSGLKIVAVLEPEQLVDFLGTHTGRLDEVWLSLPLSDENGIKTALHALRHSTANIRLAPDLFSLKLINHGVSVVLGEPMLDLSASPMTGHVRALKSLEDYVVAVAVLILLAPVMIAIAIAVRLSSPGPILYRQQRLGWNGQEILVYKFRSMVVHEEAGAQVTQATRSDPRVTAVGAFLRRTSLDELPQFINVLQGRMSVVGPRPHAMAHNHLYKDVVPGYMLRHKVKPGITGWAQIHGLRGETDTVEKMRSRVEYDLHYIENWSIWLDLKIILKTAFSGWVHRNAY
jgi:putative colanic acid biosysnthesis UDP-glucose lipid carrier transferase